MYHVILKESQRIYTQGADDERIEWETTMEAKSNRAVMASTLRAMADSLDPPKRDLS